MTMTDHVPGAELAIRAQPLLPIAADDARQAMTAYQELCRAVLTPDDMQRVGDREFVKRAGFQKLAAAYGVSTEIVSQQIDEVERDGDGETVTVLVARAVVRATHPSGRHAEGDGACSSNEKRFRRGAEKIDHDLPATAVTRATNRAISNLVAFGTVSAEEADTDTGRGSSSVPAWASPVGNVSDVARTLTELFAAAGVDEPSKAAIDVGDQVFSECAGTVPICVARAIERIAAAMNAPVSVDATATEEPATAPDTTTTTTQEKEAA